MVSADGARDQGTPTGVCHLHSFRIRNCRRSTLAADREKAILKRAMARLGVAAAMVVTATLGISQAAFAASSEADVYAGSTALAKAWFNSGSNYWVIRDTSCD